ncbi:MAG: hypothetical protein WBE34_02485, partial [Candidatus Nitrosopolaris sp.]
AITWSISVTFKVYFICVQAAFRSNVAMPDVFEVMGGTSLPPDSFAVKCCFCTRAVLVMVATMPLAVITRSDNCYYKSKR